MPLLDLDPVPTLLSRVARRAVGRLRRRWKKNPRQPRPGRLDVMGGIADYTGSLVCEMPLDRAAAVALTERDDREVQVFSFNLLDEHKPFTLRIRSCAIATARSTTSAASSTSRPQWAGVPRRLPVHPARAEADRPARPEHSGLNIAAHSTVPLGAGVSSSAAIEVATMMNLIDHFAVARPRSSRCDVAACASRSRTASSARRAASWTR
jgi:galactokinase